MEKTKDEIVIGAVVKLTLHHKAKEIISKIDNDKEISIEEGIILINSIYEDAKEKREDLLTKQVELIGKVKLIKKINEEEVNQVFNFVLKAIEYALTNPNNESFKILINQYELFNEYYNLMKYKEDTSEIKKRLEKNYKSQIEVN